MKQILIVACLISLMLGITSCTKGAYGIVFNNSGTDIVIVAGNENYNLKIAESVKIVFPTMMNDFKINKNNIELKYIVKYPSDDYVEHKPFEDIYLLQIENDGSIYAIKPKMSMPTGIPSIQPNAFPLKPILNHQ